MQKNLISLAERVSATFLFSFIGVVLASNNGVDVAALKAAAIAGGLSVAKWVYTITGSYLAQPTVVLTVDAPAPDATVVPDPVPTVRPTAATTLATPAPVLPPG